MTTNTQFGILYQPDGTIQYILPKHGKTFKLEEIQTAVGGFIEPVALKPGHGRAQMWANEEGKLRGLAFNEAATKMAWLRPGDFIVGPALVVTRQNPKPDGAS